MVGTVLWVAAALFSIQLMLLVYLLITKKRQLNFEGRTNKAYHSIIADYLAFLTGEAEKEPELPKSQRVKQEVLERLLSRFSENTITVLEKNRIQLVAETHLANIYRMRLEKGAWSERVNALYFIEDFRMLSLKETVWSHLSKQEAADEEYRQTLRVLASFHDERLMEYLVKQEALSIGVFKELFRLLPFEAFNDLVVELEKENTIPIALQEAFIAYCGESGNYGYLPFIERKLKDSNKEFRLKALRSLCLFQYCSDQEYIKILFTSEHWEERMYAARLAGIMRLSEYRDDLLKLASDTVWWVRFAACEAIKKLPDGEIFLEFAAATHEDPYARDMAKQMKTMKAGVS
ncbi:HEAT repeat domain-containing protein [Jeotgalibacillus proteolyticus]|uniref:HEAT repeat domain-containing protein n=1 Tax=Jeotgalibacillus proteolyticus TaxID=2082395 RepID=A0A2S5G8J7_9BACL|nr:HEAT repeat domain-containing protein [Jeotgalibacillus proteolyticus]PPA69299.1 hypothetical protein C4B60_15985 [Jeotgalibacillus proteolyticus]